MFKIGCHLTISNGYMSAAEEAKSIGANTFQFFSRNPRGGSARKVDIEDINKFNSFMNSDGIVCPLAHAPYTINPCSADERTREFARFCMQGDLNTLQNVKGALYNFHPGSHTGQGVEAGIKLIVDLLRSVVSQDTSTIVLLEAMSGKGSEIGSNFEELAAIIKAADLGDRLGILIDTCHIYSAGYDIVQDLDGVIERIDSTVGIGRLKGVHLNDSMNPFNAKKDRHACIGDGSIGLDAFARIINHKHLRDLPFYLETPNEVEGYKKEIALLKSLRND